MQLKTREDQGYWRQVWDRRANFVDDPDELVVGEPSGRLPLRILRRRRSELLGFIGSVNDLRLVDVGCGNGRLLGNLPGSGSRFGADLSIGMLQRFPAGAANGLVQASATRLPFADGSFDLTLCLNMLQYLDDGGTSQALAELLRVTRPGGRIILHVKNSASPVGLSRRLSQLVRRAGGKDRVVNETYRSPRWYRSALATEAHLIGGYSYGLHPIGWAPDRWLRRFIMLEEMVRTRLPNHGFGVDCFLKFRVGDAGK